VWLQAFVASYKSLPKKFGVYEEVPSVFNRTFDARKRRGRIGIVWHECKNPPLDGPALVEKAVNGRRSGSARETSGAKSERPTTILS